MTGRQQKEVSRGDPPIGFDELTDAQIVGARGKSPGLAKVLDAVAQVEARHRVQITVVDARAVCGAAHLASSVLHARSAIAAGEARARDARVDVMLFLVGQHQIKHALTRAGVGPETTTYGIVAEGPASSTGPALADLLLALRLKRDDSALLPNREKLRRVLGGPPPAGAADFEALALENTAMLRVE